MRSTSTTAALVRSAVFTVATGPAFNSIWWDLMVPVVRQLDSTLLEFISEELVKEVT